LSVILLKFYVCVYLSGDDDPMRSCGVCRPSIFDKTAHSRVVLVRFQFCSV